MNIYRFCSLFILLVLFQYCSKEEVETKQPSKTPKVTVSVQNISFSESEVASSVFTITSDEPWNLSFSDTRSVPSWCKAEPVSGGKGSTQVTVTVTEPNESYDDRNAYLKIVSGNSSSILTITQKKKDAIIVTQEKVEIGEDGGELSIEVKSNIDYIVTIPQEFSVWIKKSLSTKTRSLESKNEYFTIAPGSIEGAREGLIIFSSNNLKDTLHVYQCAKRAIILNQREYNLSSNSGKIDVELKSNVEYDVIMPAGKNWIKRYDPITKALAIDKITFSVDKNSDYSHREASIIFKDRNSNISDTLKVFQSQENAIIIGDRNIDGLSYEAGPLEVGVRTNVNFSFEFLDDSEEWISVSETRALRDTVVTFLIHTNGEYNREGSVRFVSSDGVSDTLSISQDGVKSILMDFYNSTGGDNWLINDNWGSSLPIKEWYGVYASGLIPMELHINDNNLTGSIPASIAKLKSLRTINLVGNQLTGNFEKFINDITELKGLLRLNLFKNRLYGSIPASIENFQNLEELYLQLNNLSGEIPKEISKLKKLKHIVLYSNSLSGVIPEGIGGDNPQSISLNWNKLTGPLPNNLLRNENWQKMMDYIIYQTDYTIYPPKEYAKVRNIESPDLSMQPFKAFDVISNYSYTILYYYDYSCIFSNEYTGLVVDLVNKYRNKGLGAISYHAWNTSIPGNFDKIVDYTHKKEMDKFVNLLHIGEYIDNYGSSQWRDSYFLGAPGTPSVMVVNREGELVFGIGEDRYKLPDFIKSVLGESEDKYTSTDFSKDGEVLTLQNATVGNGIDIVILGDGFVDKDMNKDGKYESKAREAMEAIFSIEPVESLRNRFNVYCVKAVSTNPGIGSGNKTVFSSKYGDGSFIGGDLSICEEYALKVPGIDKIDNVVVLTILNDPKHAGTCYYYTENSSISFCPTVGYDSYSFSQVVMHETVGHGIGKLADEYSYNDTITPEQIAYHNDDFEKYGWWANADFTSDPTKVKWKDFISNSLYLGSVGVFEGGLTYKFGVYRPSENSIMNTYSDEFNAPSRLAIYKRIMELSGEGFSYDKFIVYDAINRSVSTRSAKKDVTPQLEYKPYAPPVVVKR